MGQKEDGLITFVKLKNVCNEIQVLNIFDQMIAEFSLDDKKIDNIIVYLNSKYFS
jgi:hypothetical protein